ncbi:MAG: hypothetical protein DWQ19_09985 [Crenarchaeota archaeon]|nr:MAG: hypothetical protein DWQ19_09985 [Thermoproteota archaeon]
MIGIFVEQSSKTKIGFIVSYAKRWLTNLTVVGIQPAMVEGVTFAKKFGTKLGLEWKKIWFLFTLRGLKGRIAQWFRASSIPGDFIVRPLRFLLERRWFDSTSGHYLKGIPTCFVKPYKGLYYGDIPCRRNVKDIKKFQGIHLANFVKRVHKEEDKKYFGSDEFQNWWISGYRRCFKHAYPYEWHVVRCIECPKCVRAKEAEEREGEHRTPPPLGQAES